MMQAPAGFPGSLAEYLVVTVLEKTGKVWGEDFFWQGNGFLVPPGLLIQVMSPLPDGLAVLEKAQLGYQGITLVRIAPAMLFDDPEYYVGEALAGHDLSGK